jgi:DNA-binding MarR family transcriptional regulator
MISVVALIYVNEQGAAFLAHLLRRVSDELVRAGSQWYPEVGVTAPPRMTSTLLVLDDHGPLGVTEIALLLRQSHPLVIGWTKQLGALGFIETSSDPQDGRRSLIALTDEGRSEVQRLRVALVIMSQASRRLMEEANADVFQGLSLMDEAIQRKPFVDRLREVAATPAARRLLRNRRH